MFDEGQGLKEEKLMPQPHRGDRKATTVRFPVDDMKALDHLVAIRGGDRGQVIVDIVHDYLKSADLDSISSAQEALPIARAS
jgi:hypothetical protein